MLTIKVVDGAVSFGMFVCVFLKETYVDIPGSSMIAVCIVGGHGVWQETASLW